MLKLNSLGNEVDYLPGVKLPGHRASSRVSQASFSAESSSLWFLRDFPHIMPRPHVRCIHIEMCDITFLQRPFFAHFDSQMKIKSSTTLGKPDIDDFLLTGKMVKNMHWSLSICLSNCDFQSVGGSRSSQLMGGPIVHHQTCPHPPSANGGRSQTSNSRSTLLPTFYSTARNYPD